MMTDQRKVAGTIWNQPGEMAWTGSFYKGLPVHADDEDVHLIALEMLQGRLPTGMRVLDVGAGAGAFSLRLQDHGYGVEALELRAEAFAVPGVPVHALDLNGDWAAGLPVHFDAVVSLEVIEHLENPWHFVRQCAAAVRSGGWVLLSTPNIESSRSRLDFLLGGEFRFFKHKDHVDCGHITSLTGQQLEWVGRRAGLRLAEFRHSRHKGLPRPGSPRRTLRSLLYALSFPFMKGRKCGEESLVLYRKD